MVLDLGGAQTTAPGQGAVPARLADSAG
jgi:hypothetical protein